MAERLHRELWDVLNKKRGIDPHLMFEQVRHWLKSNNLNALEENRGSLLDLLNHVAYRDGGEYFVPPVAIGLMTSFLNGLSAKRVLDPNAGLGSIISTVQMVTGASDATAISRNRAAADLGRAVSPEINWVVGDPVLTLAELEPNIDVIASSLPLGVRSGQPVVVALRDGGTTELSGELGHQLLVAASQKLSTDGVGLFVTTSAFFWSQRSPYQQLRKYGLGVEAALALPPGSFAPLTTVESYMVIVRPHPIEELFVAQLVSDVSANEAIIGNFRSRQEGSTAEEGKFVAAHEFVGIGPLRIAERVASEERKFGFPAHHLIELAISTQFGRADERFQFEEHANAVYIPTVGLSDVVTSDENFTLKPQNYLQVAIDPEKSNARFVARFLNTELGKSIRDGSKTGSTISHFTGESLKRLRIFVPPIQLQLRMLEIESRLAVEQNNLLGLQNRLSEIHRDLWNNPRNIGEIGNNVDSYSKQLARVLSQEADESLEQWLELLPYPLAAILRAWRVTPESNPESRFLKLLNFFEASVEFMSVILLSAFTANLSFYETFRPGFVSALNGAAVRIERPDFGVWKLIFEHFAKRTRDLLNKGKEHRDICASIFSDPSNQLPEMLAERIWVEILETTRRIRNDWKGHGGLLSDAEARLLHEELLGQLQRLRKLMTDGWENVDLVKPRTCTNRRGQHLNEVALLTGSNSAFLPKTLELGVCLDAESLHLVGKNARTGLSLLPFLRLGPQTPSIQNVCYFFNRVEGDSHRMISYQLADESEIKGEFSDLTEALGRIRSGGVGSDSF